MESLKEIKDITISNDYIICTPTTIKEPTSSVGCTFFDHMQKHKDKIAQIDAKTGQEDTFSQLLQRCIRTALHMKDRNITSDHIVTLCTKNHLDSTVPYIAGQFLGATIASVDPSFTPEEMTHALSLIRPKILFVIPESVQAIEEVLQTISLNSEIVIFGQATKHTQFSDFVKPHELEDEFKPTEVKNLKDTAVIHFSSGTSGLPKGICLSHYSLLCQVLNSKDSYNSIQAQRISSNVTLLSYSSLYWISAANILLSSTIDGNCRLICADFNATKVWQYIEQYKPVFLLVTPFQLIEMLENKPVNADVTSITTILTTGSKMFKDRIQEVQQHFPEAYIIQIYGQTEVCGPVTLFNSNDIHHQQLMKQEEKMESVGLPIRGSFYKWWILKLTRIWVRINVANFA